MCPVVLDHVSNATHPCIVLFATYIQFFLADDTCLGFSSIIEVKNTTTEKTGDGLTFEIILRGSSDVDRLIDYFK